MNGRGYTVDVAAVNASGAAAHDAATSSRRRRGRAPRHRARVERHARRRHLGVGHVDGAAVDRRPAGGGYVVTAWRYDRSATSSTTTSSTLAPPPAAVIGRPRWSWYRFSVRAVNAAGTGATSARSAVVVAR